MPHKSLASSSRRRGLALISILGALLPSAVSAQALDGEYGLWVESENGELRVGWLTSPSAEGVLEVVSGGQTVSRTETPSSETHTATLPGPGEERVLLRYGRLGEADLASTTVYLRDESARASAVLSGVDSLFVVGDVHGEYDRLQQLLLNADLIDAERRWTGGRSHVVFLGDVFDRGPDVTRALWFLYGLERSAREAGGGAHVVLGNHETMIFTHDVRYVSEKEQLVVQLHGTPYPELFDIRKSVLGRWLATRPGLMQVDRVLLAHGGVAPGVTPRSVQAVNDSLWTFMSEELFYRWSDSAVGVVTDPALAEPLAEQYADLIVMDSISMERRNALIFDDESIFWFRGYVESDSLGSALNEVLTEFDADIHVVGHTPVTSIESRYDGALIPVDLFEPAAEMLLLVRDRDGYERWRIGLQGPPRAL